VKLSPLLGLRIENERPLIAERPMVGWLDSPALTALLGGQVQVFFCPLSAAVEYVRAGKLRALAVTTASGAKVD
jgi:hypothetical protein